MAVLDDETQGMLYWRVGNARQKRKEAIMPAKLAMAAAAAMVMAHRASGEPPHDEASKDATTEPGYEFRPQNIDPLAKPASKRRKRRAEAKARAAKEGEGWTG